VRKAYRSKILLYHPDKVRIDIDEGGREKSEIEAEIKAELAAVTEQFRVLVAVYKHVAKAVTAVETGESAGSNTDRLEIPDEWREGVVLPAEFRKQHFPRIPSGNIVKYYPQHHGLGWKEEKEESEAESKE
jgi:hypothetical protein